VTAIKSIISSLSSVYFSEFRAIHYHAAAASFAPAKDFAFFLHSDRSADRASNRLTSGISGRCDFF
jgi:hypothetical protein